MSCEHDSKCYRRLLNRRITLQESPVRKKKNTNDKADGRDNDRQVGNDEQQNGEVDDERVDGDTEYSNNQSHSEASSTRCSLSVSTQTENNECIDELRRVKDKLEQVKKNMRF